MTTQVKKIETLHTSFKKKSTKTIIHKTEIYEVNDNVIMKVITVTSGKKETLSTILEATKKSNIYGTPVLVNKDLFIQYLKTKNPFQDSTPFTFHADKISEESITDSDNEIVFFYYGGHVLFDSNLVPISRIYAFDYIGSPCSTSYMSPQNLKLFKEHLELREDFISASIEEIPYYNASSNDPDNLFLHIFIKPTQADYEKAFSLCPMKNEFWSVRLKEIIIGQDRKKWDYLDAERFIDRNPY